MMVTEQGVALWVILFSHSTNTGTGNFRLQWRTAWWGGGDGGMVLAVLVPGQVAEEEMVLGQPCLECP